MGTESKKNRMWFGCPKCLYRPDEVEGKSNKNWLVYNCGKCPACGEELRLNFSEDFVGGE